VQVRLTEDEEWPVEQLSGLDRWFLAMETSSVCGHVGSVCVVDAAVSHGIESPLTLEHLIRFIESRLPLVPIFRRRLVPDLDVMAGFLRDDLDELISAASTHRGPTLVAG